MSATNSVGLRQLLVPGGTNGSGSLQLRVRPWADIPDDIVSNFLQRLSWPDRGAWNCVCRSWHDAALRVRPLLPPPVRMRSDLTVTRRSVTDPCSHLTTPGDIGSGLTERRVRPWADIPDDIIGIFLQGLSWPQRASWSCVCRSWRDAALRVRPLPRLPVLMMSDLSVAYFTAPGTITALRSLGLSESMIHGGVVGSSGKWIVALQLTSNVAEYIILNLLSQETCHFKLSQMPPLSAQQYFRKYIFISNSDFLFAECTIGQLDHTQEIQKMVLSSNPDSTKFTAAASTPTNIMFWHSGMPGWSICENPLLTDTKDIAFFAGRLYVLTTSRVNMFCFHLSDSAEGRIVSRIEKCRTNLPTLPNCKFHIWNIVEWRSNMLLVARSSTGRASWEEVIEISVFRVDFSTSPFTLRRIHDLMGDCLYLSSCSVKVVQSGSYDDLQKDLVFSVDNFLGPDVFVYRLADGTSWLLPIRVPEVQSEVVKNNSLLWVLGE